MMLSMFKEKYPPIFLIFFFAFLSVSSQDNKLSAFTISKNLKENSNLVIRSSDLVINVKDVDLMIVKETKIITVLNKVGDRYLDAAVGYNNNTKVTHLQAKIYNAFGKEIKKFSKSKFNDVSAVSGGTLYSDARVMYIDFTPVSYPYTMVFESEYKTSSTGYIPNWSPLINYYISIENSSFTVNYPTELGINTKEKNFQGYTIENGSKEGTVKYSINNVNALKYEASAPTINKIRPRLLVSLNKFNTEGVKGEYSDWEQFGNWMKDKILEGKDIVDESTNSKILLLTKNAKSEIEKAKIVYKFMQDKTRYISVQVGIGGIQPIAANQVDKVGYGDCKGLTNYTKALLDIVGVESYYVHVEAGSDDIVSFENDFASLEQGNHVILNIPNNGDDIWLECTSQTMPFGFLGDFTDNRDVLVVTKDGGVIKRTPAYIDETNLRTTKAIINLDVKGNVKSTVEITSKGTRYDDRYNLETESQSELKKIYKSNIWDYNNNLEVSSITYENDRDSIVFREKIETTIDGYATINENDYLFRVNLFNRNSFVPKRYRERKLPLEITRGFKDINEYTYKIPEGYSIKFLPQEKKITTKFGSYKVTFTKIDDNTFIYKKSLLIKAGEYPKEDYALYRKFRKSVAKYENIRISLLKIN
tara:strand:- start:8155 stop:10092 length:1938 start_codon:yes stop_codon:yes gene_type:complete